MSPRTSLPYDPLKRRLEGDLPARLAGARDAEARAPGAPPPSAPPGYLSDARSRARAELHQMEADAQEEMTELLAMLQENPALIVNEHPRDRCAAAEEASRSDVEGILQAQQAILTDERETAKAARQSYQYRLQLADYPEPRGGWMSAAEYWKRVILAGTFDICLAFGVLYKPLGGAWAIFSAVLAVAVMTAGGAGVGILTLRPADQRRLGGFVHRAQQVAAAVLGAATVGILYVIMAIRAALVSGKDASAQEVLAAIGDPAVMLTGEGIALGTAGLLAFAVAVWETRGFYGRVERSLRLAGLAWEKSRAQLLGRHAAVGRAIEAAVDAGRSQVGRIGAAYQGWATTAAQAMDRAVGRVYRHNRGVELVQSALESIEADFRDGFTAVRGGDTPAWARGERIGEPLMLPEAFREARQVVVNLGTDATEVTRQAQEILTVLRADALALLDHLAGLTALPAPDGPAGNAPRPPPALRLPRAA